MLPEWGGPLTTANQESVWLLATAEVPEALRLDDDAAIFNPVSWETHLVNEPADRILRSLARGPRTPSELASDVYGDPDAEPAREVMVAQLIAALEEMESLGLVKREPAAG